MIRRLGSYTTVRSVRSVHSSVVALYMGSIWVVYGSIW